MQKVDAVLLWEDDSPEVDPVFGLLGTMVRVAILLICWPKQRRPAGPIPFSPKQMEISMRASSRNCRARIFATVSTPLVQYPFNFSKERAMRDLFPREGSRGNILESTAV